VEINGSVTVADTNGGQWSVSNSGSISYDGVFSCADSGQNNNTATIVETGQSDSAQVTVNCFSIGVSNSASTSFDRKYDWTIDKTADQSTITLAVNEQLPINYAVEVDAVGVDSNWLVTGQISITNPAPIPAVIDSISSVLSPSIPAVIDLGGNTLPLTIAAGGTLTLSYSAALPSGTDTTNTTQVVLRNHNYDSLGNATPAGTTTFSATGNVSFSSAAITEIDKCADVTDSLQGVLGTVCYPDVPKSFTYAIMAGPYEQSGDYSIENTATVTAQTTSTSVESDWDVQILVPSAGCTLTPGYWKTHSKYGPAPFDNTWLLLAPAGEDSPFFDTGKTWYQTLWTPPAGNAYYILAHAYAAAYMNMLHGADTTAVATQLAQAQLLLDKYDGNPLPMSQITKSVKTQFTALGAALDNYNNGLTGPGHCTE
jgi:hypothetical protein